MSKLSAPAAILAVADAMGSTPPDSSLREFMRLMVVAMIEFETTPSDDLYDRIEGLDQYGRSIRRLMNKAAGIIMSDWEIDRVNTIMRIKIRDAMEVQNV